MNHENTEKILSIIIPVYNEQANIEPIYRQVKAQMNKSHYDYEFIFINDGSIDESISVLKNLQEKDKRIKILDFSRNFGKEIALSAGIHYCRGSAAIMIDADLQHPIELIPEFINRWRSGAEVVIGIRKINQSEGMIKKIGSYLFYRIIGKISSIKLLPNTTDFRLIDKKVINEFKKFTERQRMTRALIDWLGFKRDFVYFTARKRASGKPSYNLRKLIRLALNSFISLSLLPLKVAGYLGIIIISISSLLGIAIFIEKYLLNDILVLKISGTAILGVIIMFLSGITLLSLGLMALYIAHIHEEVTNRPLYIIREKKGFEKT